ncbi:MAG: alpha/beta fold hydrolase [Candidatus Geothermincolia bacterium]
METTGTTGLNYVEKGSGIPIVMLPGAEGCKQFWHFQVDALSSRYRAIATDLLVNKPSSSSCMADYAAYTLGIMDSLGIDKAVVMGESFGGMVTQEIAVNHPERTLAVILCNTLDRARGDAFGLNMFTLATFVAMLTNSPLIPLEIKKRILMWVGKHRGLVYDPTPGNKVLVDYFCEYGLEQGMMAQVDRLGFAGRKARYTERLREISVPTLVLHGSEDRISSGNTATEIAGRIPQAELVLIEGGGHCHQQTMPDETNAVLLDWLARNVTP